jgi:hypothetical protein
MVSLLFSFSYSVHLRFGSSFHQQKPAIYRDFTSSERFQPMRRFSANALVRHCYLAASPKRHGKLNTNRDGGSARIRSGDIGECWPRPGSTLYG